MPKLLRPGQDKSNLREGNAQTQVIQRGALFYEKKAMIPTDLETSQTNELYNLNSCGKHSKGLRKLSDHSRKQLMAKTHRCPYCPMTFRTTSNRNDHQRRHQFSKPYECCFCEKKYYRRYQRNQHIYNCKNQKGNSKVKTIFNIKKVKPTLLSRTSLKKALLSFRQHQCLQQEKLQNNLADFTQYNSNNQDILTSAGPYHSFERKQISSDHFHYTRKTQEEIPLEQEKVHSKLGQPFLNPIKNNIQKPREKYEIFIGVALQNTQFQILQPQAIENFEAIQNTRRQISIEDLECQGDFQFNFHNYYPQQETPTLKVINNQKANQSIYEQAFRNNYLLNDQQAPLWKSNDRNDQRTCGYRSKVGRHSSCSIQIKQIQYNFLDTINPQRGSQAPAINSIELSHNPNKLNCCEIALRHLFDKILEKEYQA